MTFSFIELEEVGVKIEATWKIGGSVFWGGEIGETVTLGSLRPVNDQLYKLEGESKMRLESEERQTVGSRFNTERFRYAELIFCRRWVMIGTQV